MQELKLKYDQMNGKSTGQWLK